MRTFNLNVARLFVGLLMFGAISLHYSCDDLEEALGIEDVSSDTSDDYSDDTSGGSSSNENPSYEYTYTCPVSGDATVTIPPGTTQCQQAYEFFARTYGCNDIENFNQANCLLCYDCGWTDYCSVCED